MDTYLIVKSLHIISIIAWMAGLLYLPRLFVYHVGVETGSDSDKMLQTMEKKLLRYIMNPAMIATYVFGFMLVHQIEAFKEGWFHTKFLLVIFLTIIHHVFAYHRKKFASGTNQKSEKYFRIINEAPTILMIGIVFLVILKPF